MRATYIRNIVETEAYKMDDPASHSFNGRTIRNDPMFNNPGTIYIYFTYGMHYCLNIVCGPENNGQAVLIRAIEPMDGIELMNQRRHTENIGLLTNGPAKLVQALHIGKELNNQNIFYNDCPIKLAKAYDPESIVCTNRIGISNAKNKKWRFYIRSNLYVSKP